MNPENQAARSSANARPRMSKRNRILLIIASLAMMAMFRTGFIFVIIAMMPSIVTYYIDASRKRYVFKTIFACNLSGVMPFIGKILFYGPSSSVMQTIMGDAGNWLLVYGSALIGLLMVRVMPMIAHTLIGGFHTTQIARLSKNQKRIENEWGDEVTQFSKEQEEEKEFWF